jgi:hypothetical protein
MRMQPPSELCASVLPLVLLLLLLLLAVIWRRVAGLLRLWRRRLPLLLSRHDRRV